MNRNPKLKVLFLCLGNACRSQMAEGWARHLKGDVIEPCSAGVAPSDLDTYAVKVMAEAGVDISNQRSKHIDEVAGISFDAVINLCETRPGISPIFTGEAKVIHKPFEDPPLLAMGAETEDEVLEIYRGLRDEIKEFVASLPESLEE